MRSKHRTLLAERSDTGQEVCSAEEPQEPPRLAVCPGRLDGISVREGLAGAYDLPRKASPVLNELVARLPSQVPSGLQVDEVADVHVIRCSDTLAEGVVVESADDPTCDAIEAIAIDDLPAAATCPDARRRHKFDISRTPSRGDALARRPGMLQATTETAIRPIRCLVAPDATDR